MLFDTLSDPTIGTWDGIAEEIPMQAVGVHPDALKADTLQFPLMGETVTAVRADNTSFNPHGWAGSLSEDPTSSVVLYGQGDTMIGRIQYHGQHYYIYKQDDTHKLMQMPPSFDVYKDEELVILPAAYKHNLEKQIYTNRNTLADDGSILDIMFIYTDDVLAAAGSQEKLQIEMEWVMYEINATASKSQANFLFQLVYADEVNYDEDSGSPGDLLAKIVDGSDGYYDETHTWRDTYGADLVAVWTVAGCGGSPLLDPRVEGASEYAFTVISRDCALMGYTLDHEVGHLLGSGHGYLGGDLGVLPYSQGYHNSSLPSGQSFVTIMSGQPDCNNANIYCVTLDMWSNSDVSVYGVPAGNYDLANNVRAFNEFAPYVANFRAAAIVATPTSTPTSTPDTNPTATPTNTPVPTSSPTATPTTTPLPSDPPVPDPADIILEVDTTVDSNAPAHQVCTTIGIHDCSLRGAITTANNNNANQYEIRLQPNITYTLTLADINPENYNVNGDLDVRGYVVLNGNGATIDGQSISDRVIEVHSGSLVVQDATLINGVAGSGGAIRAFAPLTVISSTLAYNTATNYGGGAISAQNSDVTIANSTIMSNSAGFVGGGIYASGSSNVYLSNNEIYLNHSQSGGGVLVDVNANKTVSITYNTIYSNTATDAGGMHIEDGQAITVTNNVIHHNSATGDGGGVQLNSIQAVTLFANNVVAHNDAQMRGGGLDVSGQAVISNTMIYSNTAAEGGGGGLSIPTTSGAGIFLNEVQINNNVAALKSGGGINILEGTIYINGGSLSHNQSGYYGGGMVLFAETSKAFLDHVTIENNVAEVDGGGINLQDNSQMTITHSLIQSNTVGSAGGGIFGGTFYIENSNVLHNQSAGFGGGIWGNGTIVNSLVAFNQAFEAGAVNRLLGGGMYAAGPTTIINSTIYSNTVTGPGGGLFATDSLTLTHVTIANNYGYMHGRGLAMTGNRLVMGSTLIADHFRGMDCESSATEFDDLGYNLIQGGACAITTTSLALNLQYANMGVLADNGGETWSVAPHWDSLIIDAIPEGVNGCNTTLTTDQRGQPRLAGGGCDIGAFEQQLVRAQVDSYHSYINTPLVVTATHGVISNDSVGSVNANLTVVNYGQPTVGSVVVQADGGFVFTPTVNMTGTAVFTYTVSDALYTDIATATINVAPFTLTPSLVSPTTVSLSWVEGPPSCQYELYANTTPYTAPTGSPLVTLSSTSYEVTTETRFFMVQAVNCGGVDSLSNEVGIFSFAIEPG